MSLPCTPPVDLENDLNIDQKTDNIDTCSCQLNSFFNSLVELMNTLDINGSINLDINAFINCTRPQWDKPTFRGISDYDIARFRQAAINYYNGPAGAGLSNLEKEQIINQIISNANQSFKILQWLGSGGRSGQAGDIASSRIIPFTIKCSSDKQSYNSVGSDECNKECLVDIPIILQTRSSKVAYTVEKLMEKLKSGFPVSCGLDQPPEYFTNFNSDNTDNEIIATIDNYSQNLGYSTHAVSCIGFECDGDYVIFIFKDSFEYGTTIKRPGIFKIRVNKNLKYVPFGVGNRLALEGERLFLNCIFPIKKKNEIENSINEALEKCCVNTTPTPTPTPTAEPWYPSSTPTPTPTPTPSDIFGPPPPTPSFSF